jgi:hypothetical protein
VLGSSPSADSDPATFRSYVIGALTLLRRASDCSRRREVVRRSAELDLLTLARRPARARR